MKDSANDFDALLTYHVGGFGRYQKFLFLTLSMVAVGVAWHNLLHVFTGAELEHICASGRQLYLEPVSDTSLYSTNQTLSFFEVTLKEITPYNESVSRGNERCFYKHGSNQTLDNKTADVTVACQRWVYDTSQYTSSVVSEWNLVCERSWLSPLSQSLHFVGCLVGAVLFGHLSDRFGRRKLLVVTTVLEVVIGITTAFSPRYEIYAALRFLVGMAIAGQFTCAYVILIEIVGPKWRSLASVGVMYFNSLGFMILAVMAYLIRDWHHLQLAMSAPLVLLLAFYWIIPESPRWLITHGKVEEATDLIRKMARWNQTNAPDDLTPCLRAHKIPKTTHYSLFDLFKRPKLRQRTLLITFIWFAVSTSYFGLSLNTSHLGGNDYLNFFLSGLVEVPAYTFCLWSLNRLGRKVSVLSSMLLAGVTLLVTGALPSHLHITRMVLSMLGKFGVSIAFASSYSLSVELFPTVVRNNGLGICAVAARVGSFVAPYIVLNTSELDRVLPFVILGTITFTGGVFCIFLPETRGQHLPDSLEDAENMNTIYWHCNRRREDRHESSNGLITSVKSSRWEEITCREVLVPGHDSNSTNLLTTDACSSVQDKTTQHIDT